MRRRGGLTLAETLLAAVILAAAALALWATVGAGRAQGGYSDRFRWAGDVGDELIERIVALPYSRSSDYHGFTESPGELRDAAGALLPEHYQAFTRSVAMKYETHIIPALGGRPIDGLTVTVAVVGADGGRLTLTRFIHRPVDDD